MAVRFITEAGPTNIQGLTQFQYTGTVSLANVQFEKGTDTDYEDRDVGLELTLCQRYYETGHKHESLFATPGIPTNEMWQEFAVTKRVNPSVVFNFFIQGPTLSNITTLFVLTDPRPDGFAVRFSSQFLADAIVSSAVQTSPFGPFGPWTADAEL